jgi:superoxide dismutase, Fe-Mn family
MNSSVVSRRTFLASAAASLAATAAGAKNTPPRQGVPLRLEPLPFGFEALQPCFSPVSLRRHYEIHHAGQLHELSQSLGEQRLEVASVVSLMPGMDRLARPSRQVSSLPLGRLVSQGVSHQPPEPLSPQVVRVIRQAGGGHVNHTVFWRCLCPPGSGPSGPRTELARAIRDDFGSVRTFRRVFKEAAMAHEGSGWAWLVYRQDRSLVVSTTANEDNPLMKDHVPWHQAGRPILALDLWEHSYYETHGNDRERYIDSWWNVLNWNFVERAYQIVSNT